MKKLVKSTCQQSIEKVCTTQYNDNPPYTCTSYTRYSILTVLSLSFSTTMAIIGVVAILLTTILTIWYPTYTSSTEPHVEKEIELVNKGLGKKDPLHEEFQNLMKFCDDVAVKFGLETSHRPQNGVDEQANTNAQMANEKDVGNDLQKPPLIDSLTNQDPTASPEPEMSHASIEVEMGIPSEEVHHLS